MKTELFQKLVFGGRYASPATMLPSPMEQPNREQAFQHTHTQTQPHTYTQTHEFAPLVYIIYEAVVADLREM